MRVAQRAVSANTSSAFNFFVHDRWQNGVNGHGGDSGARFTWTQSTDVPSDQGFKYSLKLNTITPDTTTGTNKYQIMRHVIEQQNIVDLNFSSAQAKTFTLSFWVKSSVTGTYSASFLISGATRSYIATYTVNSADTWEKKTITIAGDTSGTWNKTNGIGININWALGVGTDFQGTAGSWTATNDLATSGSVSWIGTLGATFYITGVQLEPGTVATPFERRSYGQELALCQRYYCKTFPVTTAPAQNVISNGALGYVSQTTTASTDVGWRFPVEMRLAPSVVTTYSTNANSANWSTNTDTPTSSLFYQGSTGLTVRGSASGAAGRGYSIHVSAEAEL
jgi:hypothetical protein